LKIGTWFEILHTVLKKLAGKREISLDISGTRGI
jgi:hypothetical protein